LNGDLSMMDQNKNGCHPQSVRPAACSGVCQVVVLLANGCETTTLQSVLEQLCGENRGVWLVGLRCGPVIGQGHVQFVPELTLAELGETTAVTCLLLPDGQACSDSLLCDPRVHRLMERVVAQQGLIVALGSSAVALRQMPLLARISVGEFSISSIPCSVFSRALLATEY
jgi:hypothetical protein